MRERYEYAKKIVFFLTSSVMFDMCFVVFLIVYLLFSCTLIK